MSKDRKRIRKKKEEEGRFKVAEKEGKRKRIKREMVHDFFVQNNKVEVNTDICIVSFLACWQKKPAKDLLVSPHLSVCLSILI
jgi:hypothetical protein